jgi:nitronate monooxygenase
MFGLDYPIVSAPMAGGHSDGALAAAVSKAGGLGTFGAMHPARDAAWLRDEIAHVREHTDRPFGVGFITHFIQFLPQFFDAALECAPPVIAFSFADPRPWSERAKATGAKLLCQVQTLELAQAAVDAGADVLAAQGNEAGGHTGVMGLLPFVGKLLDTFPETPILAAGGIGDARALAAVLAAGADGAWVGTAFLATTESPEPDDYKKLIVASDGEDTVFTRAYDIASGFPWPEPIGERVRINRFTMRWQGREEELKSRQQEVNAEVADAAARADWNEASVLYGPAAAFIDDIRPAGEVMREISEGAERILRERPGALLA